MTKFVNKGIYRETIRPSKSGNSGNYLTYQAYNGETVTFTTSGDGANLVLDRMMCITPGCI